MGNEEGGYLIGYLAGENNNQITTRRTRHSNFSNLLRMLTPRLDLVPPQRKRAIASPQTQIHPTCIAEPRAGLAPPPHARLARMTVRTLWPLCVRRRIWLLFALHLLVGGDEREGPQLLALLKVEAARIAQQLPRRGVAAPEWCRRRGTVGAAFWRGGVDAAAP
jgi:hypothetical protein